jgi:hypothetical protein
MPWGGGGTILELGLGRCNYDASTIYRMSLISTRSISLDSAFNSGYHLIVLSMGYWVIIQIEVISFLSFFILTASRPKVFTFLLCYDTSKIRKKHEVRKDDTKNKTLYKWRL